MPLAARLTSAAASIALAIAPRLAAQQPAPGKPAEIHVRVVDSAGAPLRGIQVFFLRDEQAVRVCVSDAGGRCAFAFPVENAAYAVTARRIGFLAASAGFRAAPGRVDTLQLTLRRSAAQLDTVRSTADNVLEREYTLDAAAIDSAHRPIRDALEALRKLRPFMLGDTWRTCPLLEHIWVNGQRVWDEGPMVPIPGPAGAPRGMHYFGRAGEPDSVVLFWIKPDHILNMRYVNCFDTSHERTGMNNALFVTLRPGVDWTLERGSRVTDSAQFLAGLAAEQGTGEAVNQSPTVMNAARALRIVGVYDAVSGDPLGGVQVRDTVTGISATTTKTGTVALTLLEPPFAVLVFHKEGYVDQLVRIRVSPADTMPLTVILPHRQN